VVAETAADVKCEARRLYRAARRRDGAAADASRLASVPALAFEVVENAELESVSDRVLLAHRQLARAVSDGLHRRGHRAA
jgi:hypothetical protein